MFELLRIQRNKRDVEIMSRLFACCFEMYCKEIGIELPNETLKFQFAFRKFKALLESGKLRQPFKSSVWESFLGIYHENENAIKIPFQSEWSHFLPRTILVAQLEAKNEYAQRAIEKCYRQPAEAHYRKGGLKNCAEFEEVFSHSLQGLFKKPPLLVEKKLALLYTFFCTILTRRAIDICNKKDKLNIVGVDYDQLLEVIDEGVECHNSTETVDYVVEAYNLAELAGTDDDSSAVSWLLSQLDEACEELISAFYLKGWSYEVIAERLKMNPRSVGTTIKRCKDKLTKLLAKLKDDSDE